MATPWTCAAPRYGRAKSATTGPIPPHRLNIVCHWTHERSHVELVTVKPTCRRTTWRAGGDGVPEEPLRPFPLAPAPEHDAADGSSEAQQQRVRDEDPRGRVRIERDARPQVDAT